MELLQLENIVLTQLKVRVPILLGDSFPNLTFTNKLDDKKPTFPNVYVHELEPSEVGNSIPNQTIHAIRDTIQIEVTTNVNMTDARTVAIACVNAMKALKYGLVSGPTHVEVNNIHRYIIRMRRVVANGDVF